jgi:beta-lactamase regulating signal transducer with metallopeptidase domain
MILGMMVLRWIKLNCRAAASSTSRAVGRLSARMGIQPPRVGVTDRVTQAMVTGILRPMVILPTAWVTQLRPDFLEAVLSHELAHLRRWDLWTIYVQRLTETVLFFHPAVWWLSSRLQQEREWCCDAFAVRVTGEPVVYVCALERVASWQRELCMPCWQPE